MDASGSQKLEGGFLGNVFVQEKRIAVFY